MTDVVSVQAPVEAFVSCWNHASTPCLAKPESVDVQFCINTASGLLTLPQPSHVKVMQTSLIWCAKFERPANNA